MSKTDSTTTTPTAKKKRQVTPAQFSLVSEQTDEGGDTIFRQLPLPEGIDLNNPKHRSRAAIEAAVKKNLEEGKRVDIYGNQTLRVIDTGAGFRFNAKEEVKKTFTVEAAKIG